MNKGIIIALGTFVLLGAGCVTTAPTTPVGYTFTCYQGPKTPSEFRVAIDGDLKKAGWETTDSSYTQVCVRTDGATKEALVITLGPTCDITQSIGCEKIGILISELEPQRTDILALISTSEMYGMSLFDSILSWNQNALSYRVNGEFPDGGCTEKDVKETYAQQDRVVDLTSERQDRESVTQTCHQTSCSDATLQCK